MASSKTPSWCWMRQRRRLRRTHQRSSRSRCAPTRARAIPAACRRSRRGATNTAAANRRTLSCAFAAIQTGVGGCSGLCEFCIKNDEFCIRNAEFCIKMMKTNQVYWRGLLRRRLAGCENDELCINKREVLYQKTRIREFCIQNDEFCRLLPADAAFWRDLGDF